MVKHIDLIHLAARQGANLALFPELSQRLRTKAGGSIVLAPGICYESLQSSHAEQAAESGAQVYLASVAKSERGVASAYSHYPTIAKKLSMTVLMANYVGATDNFIAAGLSAIWNSDGEIVCSTDAFQEALLAYNLQTGETGIFSVT
ncbi:hypothetical protein EI969_05715 [Pseudomonas sp. PB101]|nr:hypothetical protein [Pseudomonas sp. PB101]